MDLVIVLTTVIFFLISNPILWDFIFCTSTSAAKFYDFLMCTFDSPIHSSELLQNNDQKFEADVDRSYIVFLSFCFHFSRFRSMFIWRAIDYVHECLFCYLDGNAYFINKAKYAVVSTVRSIFVGSEYFLWWLIYSPIIFTCGPFFFWKCWYVSRYFCVFFISLLSPNRVFETLPPLIGRYFRFMQWFDEVKRLERSITLNSVCLRLEIMVHLRM